MTEETKRFFAARNLSLTHKGTDRGRGVFVAEHVETIPPGTEIFRGNPFAAILLYSLWGSHCFCCFGKLPAIDEKLPVNTVQQLRVCRCEVARYCSDDCLKDDEEAHREECQRLQAFVGHVASLEALSYQVGVASDIATEAVLLCRTLRRIVALRRPTPHGAAAAAGQGGSTAAAAGQGGSTAAAAGQGGSTAAAAGQGGSTAAEGHVGSEALVSRASHFGGSVADVNSLCETAPLKSDGLRVLQLVIESRLALKKSSELMLRRMLVKFQCNNFQIADSLMDPVGFGVYPLGSMINHSCVPNCVATFDSKTHCQVFRCLRSVQCDEELTITYTELAAPTFVRRQNLIESYGFRCDCVRCMDGLKFSVARAAPVPFQEARHAEDSHLEETVSHLQQSSGGECVDLDAVLLADRDGNQISATDSTKRHAIARAAQLATAALNSSSSSQQRESLLYQSVTLLEGALHPFNLQLYVGRGKLMTAALDNSNWLLAKNQCEKVVGFLRAVYFGVGPHPMLALNLMTLSDVHDALGNSRDAAVCRKEAADMIRIAYGNSHAYVRMLEKPT